MNAFFFFSETRVEINKHGRLRINSNPNYLQAYSLSTKFILLKQFLYLIFIFFSFFQFFIKSIHPLCPFWDQSIDFLMRSAT